ncbi:hypothetical protein [Guopingia tenuis]|uniref:hypothetical protein n=1 Tax=Guopingia tenuis TaxID=2763656 RepID=UPI0020161AD1|nr:hypothetical protein [Guopingia tenuis]
MKRLNNLLCVKSIVTIVLAAVFAYLSITGKISGHDFLTVFSVVIAFYFGTQSQRLNEKISDDTNKNDSNPAK